MVLLVLLASIGCVPPDPFSSLVPTPQVPLTPARPVPLKGQTEISLSLDPIYIRSDASDDPEGPGRDWAGMYQPYSMLDVDVQIWATPGFSIGFQHSRDIGKRHRVSDAWDVPAPHGNLQRTGIYLNGLIPVEDDDGHPQAWIGIQPSLLHATLPVERIGTGRETEKFLAPALSLWMAGAINDAHSLLGGFRAWSSYEVDNWVPSSDDMELLQRGGPVIMFVGWEYYAAGEACDGRLQVRPFITLSNENEIWYGPSAALSLSILFPGSATPGP